MWLLKIDWNNPLPPNMSIKWTQFITHLSEISNLTFPRWIAYQSDYSLKIHGFSDASKHAISAVVYLRSTTIDGQITSCLVAYHGMVSASRLSFQAILGVLYWPDNYSGIRNRKVLGQIHSATIVNRRSVSYPEEESYQNPTT